jgi:DNA-binding XRE family transcriptional regulator
MQKRKPRPAGTKSKVARKSPEELYTLDERTFLRRIGRRIAGLRVERDLTQIELATKAKINRSYLGFIEVGQRNPHLLSLCKIAHGLNVPVFELIKIEGKEKTAD